MEEVVEFVTTFNPDLNKETEEKVDVILNTISNKGLADVVFNERMRPIGNLSRLWLDEV